MAEQKESSVLFSLKELMNLEEDRIKQEETERQRQEQAVIQARLDAERKAREEEEARMAAAEEQRRQQEQRSREEMARLEAIRHAEVEQLRQQQAHDLNLTAIKQDKSKKNLLYIAVGVGVALVLAVAIGGYAVKVQSDKAAALQAQLAQLVSDEADIKQKMASANAEDRARLQEELDAKESAIQNLKDHPNTVQTTAPVHASHPTGGGNTTKPATTSKPCNCTPGDPLCSCL